MADVAEWLIKRTTDEKVVSLNLSTSQDATAGCLIKTPNPQLY